MGFRRALTLAIVAVWGLATQAVPARADGAPVPADDYSPYAPSGFFVFDWSGFYLGGHLGALHTNVELTDTFVAPSSGPGFEAALGGAIGVPLLRISRLSNAAAASKAAFQSSPWRVAVCWNDSVTCTTCTPFHQPVSVLPDVRTSIRCVLPAPTGASVADDAVNT